MHKLLTISGDLWCHSSYALITFKSESIFIKFFMVKKNNLKFFGFLDMMVKNWGDWSTTRRRAGGGAQAISSLSSLFRTEIYCRRRFTVELLICVWGWKLKSYNSKGRKSYWFISDEKSWSHVIQSTWTPRVFNSRNYFCWLLNSSLVTNRMSGALDPD